MAYIWPGLIGVSKDFLPLAGQHKNFSNVYYIGGAAGLPWAAALGKYIADKIISGRQELDEHFTADRNFVVNKKLQSIISKPISFAVSHTKTKYI